MSENSKHSYDPRARDAKAFEERMALTSFKGKSIEFLIRAEGAADSEMGQYFASIAQAYATLELARATTAAAKKTTK